MTKKSSSKKLSSDEAIIEIFKASLDYINKTDELDLKFLNHKIEFLQQQIAFKENEEPMKIFKKAHKKWEEELDDLETQLMNAYKDYGDEVMFQHEFYQKLKGN